LPGLAHTAVERVRKFAWRALNRPRFLELGPGAFVVDPILITPECIRLKDRVFIFAHGRIQGVTRYQDVPFSPEIVFDEGSSAQQNLHLTCANRVYIGKETALAANVTITDIDHPYRDVNVPIEWQPLKVCPVHIGDGCKIYNNAVILPGTRIGDHCVVGANSVVWGSFESFTVISGNPARAIRQYDPASGTWVRANVRGERK
jgi:acetyltransferase-like isoleucine patch superfamily enzyme